MKAKRKIFSLLLAFVMVFGMLPAVGEPAYAETYTVTFDANGGSGSMENMTVDSSGAEYGALLLPENKFTAPDGKQFDYWNVDGEKLEPGESAVIREATTVKAVWKDIVYFDVTLDPGKGSASTPVTVQVQDEDEYQLPENTFTPPYGYEDVAGGWYINDKFYGPGYLIQITGDTTVKAAWRSSRLNTNLVWVGGVGLEDGEYVDEDGWLHPGAPTDQDDNYAYLSGSTLKLKNFNYRGDTTDILGNSGTDRGVANPSDAMQAMIIKYFAGQTQLTIELEGENSLICTSETDENTEHGIYVKSGDMADVSDRLVIKGGGSLTIEAEDEGIRADECSIEISDVAKLDIRVGTNGIYAEGTLSITDSDVNIDVSGTKGVIDGDGEGMRAENGITLSNTTAEVYNHDYYGLAIWGSDEGATSDIGPIWAGTSDVEAKNIWDGPTVEKPTYNLVADDEFGNNAEDYLYLKIGGDIEEYVVRFDNNGGSGTKESDSTPVTPGEYTLPSDDGFTAPSGKYFKGWSKTAGGSEVLSEGEKITITEDTTLYAIWAVDMATVIVDTIPDVTYTGSEIKPDIKVRAGGALMKEGTDYSLTYSNNINAGTAKITISGMGHNTSSKEVSFIISPATVTIRANDVTAYVGDAEPTYTYTVTGLAVSDRLASEPVLTAQGADMNTAGTYTIKASGAALPADKAANYNSEIIYEDGTLTVKTKYSGGGTGGSIPSTPTTTPVTVPISGDENSIDVGASVTGDKAVIDEVNLEHLDTVIGDNVDTGVVTIDFSTLGRDLSEVEIPADVVHQIAEAVNNPNNDARSLEIVFSDGTSIEFDAVALGTKSAKADGLDITISILPATKATPSAPQKEVIGKRPFYDISVTSGGKHISDMGGHVSIHAPYDLKPGERAEGIVVYYVDDNGRRERCETSYDSTKKRVNWKTDHLSVYMIDHEEVDEDQLLKDAMDQIKLVARSKRVTMKDGRKAIRIIWYDEAGADLEKDIMFDGVEVFRSLQRYKGYGKKPIFTSKTGKYYNTAIKTGTRYYYKVRGYVIIDGEKYYTGWSKKAWRTAK